MSCGLGHTRGLDPTWLWLWCRPAAAAPIQPLAWKLPYAAGTALKSKKDPPSQSHSPHGVLQSGPCSPQKPQDSSSSVFTADCSLQVHCSHWCPYHHGPSPDESSSGLLTAPLLPDLGHATPTPKTLQPRRDSRYPAPLARTPASLISNSPWDPAASRPFCFSSSKSGSCWFQNCGVAGPSAWTSSSLFPGKSQLKHHVPGEAFPEHPIQSEHYSKGGSWTSSIVVTLDLVRHTNLRGLTLTDQSL